MGTARQPERLAGFSFHEGYRNLAHEPVAPAEPSP